MQGASLWDSNDRPPDAARPAVPPAGGAGRGALAGAGGLPVALTALALGVAADRLFYGQGLGLNAPLAVLLLLGALAVLARRQGARPVALNLWLLIPALLFFAGALAVRANGVLTALNALAVVTLLALVATFALAGRLHRLGVMGYPLVWLQVPLEALLRPAPALAGAVRAGTAGRVAGRRAVAPLRRVAPVLRGFVLAAPVLLLFTALLASADSIFAGYLEDALRPLALDWLPDLSPLAWHLTLILTVAWIAAGGLLFALQRGAGGAGAALLLGGEGQSGVGAQVDGPPGAGGSPRRRLGFVEGATVLALVDILFALFVAVQAAYLFGGRAAATMDFERYRDYARRGFFELLVVTVLTMGLILSVRWLISRRTVRQAYALNLLCSLTIGLALVMLASALQRLVVWEGVQYYISSPTRLYVRTFVAWLALSYGWLLVTVWLRHDRFAIGGFVCAVGFLVTVNVLDPDADTARYNLTRRDDLATRYVHLLSDDAVPALAAGLGGTGGAERERLREHLSDRLRRLESEGPRGWQSAHLARERAHRALLTLRAQGQID